MSAAATCSKTGVYPTREEAFEALVEIAFGLRGYRGRRPRKPGKPTWAYRCPACGQWHLTSKEQRP